MNPIPFWELIFLTSRTRDGKTILACAQNGSVLRISITKDELGKRVSKSEVCEFHTSPLVLFNHQVTELLRKTYGQIFISGGEEVQASQLLYDPAIATLRVRLHSIDTELIPASAGGKKEGKIQAH